MVEAMQNDGSRESVNAIEAWAGDEQLVRWVTDGGPNHWLCVQTPHGQVTVQPCEWLIQDAAGFHACEPDIFEATYIDASE